MVGPTCTFITVYLVFDDHLRKAKFLWIIKRRNHSTNDFLVFLLRLRKITKETSLPKRYINLITLLELAENALYSFFFSLCFPFRNTPSPPPPRLLFKKHQNFRYCELLTRKSDWNKKLWWTPKFSFWFSFSAQRQNIPTVSSLDAVYFVLRLSFWVRKNHENFERTLWLHVMHMFHFQSFNLSFQKFLQLIASARVGLT